MLHKMFLPPRAGAGEVPGAEQSHEVQQRAGPGPPCLAQDGPHRGLVRSGQIHPRPRHLESPG